MRIHTDNVTAVETAIRQVVDTLPGVYVERLTTHRSRKRAGALDLALSGNSSRNTQSGEYKAATWDEWGVVLAAVFAADTDADATYYQGAEHFHWMTGNRFHAGMPADTHAQHKWGVSGESATGSYYVDACTKCAAVSRRMAVGHDWAEIAN
jgi:hypothetical protein